MKPNLITLRVWGDFACFTRPEMKVERVSYPVMTPSAARGILEAVFWEPQMLYLIDSVRVVKRGRWVSFRRMAFSVATAGCNVNCKMCQNWDISQVRPEQVTSTFIPPKE